MLDNLVILITNAEHFVGPCSADVLAGHGANVICHDVTFSDAAARDAFVAAHPSVVAAEATEPEALAAEVIAAYGRIDVLICNDAYPAVRAPVDEAEAAEMDRALQSLVVWPFRLISAVVPAMKERGAGKILMITSAAPIRGLANYSMYATARGAGNAMVKSLSLELAPHNIQVNAIAPNYIENPTYFPPELLANEKAMTKMLSNIPAKRLGKPEEVAETIAFFASNRCGFITGHVVPIAGGWA
jgi:NAD(P)-dependent dehydrogenase (short-subunit alcohol dehydrogenase family)